MAELKFIDTGIFKICSGITAYFLALFLVLRLGLLFSLSSTIILFISILTFAIICILNHKFFITATYTAKVGTSAFFWGVISTYAMQLFIDSEKKLIWVIIFFLIYLFLYYMFNQIAVGRKTLVYSSVLGFLFASFELIGYLFEKQGGFLKFELHPGFVSLILKYIGLGILFTILLVCFFSELVNRNFLARDGCKLNKCSKILRIFIFATIFFACWLIYYIAFYPGILSIDSVLELDQQLGNSSLSNHHPIIHQLFIKLCLIIGRHSVADGVAVYSLLQMGIMALIFSTGISFLIEKKVSRLILSIAICFYAFNPIIGLYCITMWKDILFGGVTLLLVISLIRSSEQDCIPIKLTIVVVLFAFLFCILRNNGYYAFILCFPFYIIANRKNWKKLSAMFAAVLCLVSFYQHIIFDVAHARESESIEALSVPIQQIARVVKICGANDENFTVLHDIFPDIEKFGDLYMGDRVDSIKVSTSFLSETFSNNPTKYAKAWFRLGLKHPIIYLEAFLNESYGYYYTDVNYWIATTGECPNSYGISFNPKYENLRDGLTTLFNDLIFDKPVAILSSAGLTMWICTICAVLLILKGYGKISSSLIILGTYWLTVLAGPVYCEFRYIFGIYIVMPLLLGLAIALPAQDLAEIG